MARTVFTLGQLNGQVLDVHEGCFISTSVSVLSMAFSLSTDVFKISLKIFTRFLSILTTAEKGTTKASRSKRGGMYIITL